MQAIRQIIETQKLKNLLEIPEDFSSDKVEVIVFPVYPEKNELTEPFNPDEFFGISHLKNTEQLLADMRNEWEN